MKRTTFGRIFKRRHVSSRLFLKLISRLPRKLRLKVLKGVLFARRHQLPARLGAVAMAAVLVFGWGFEIFGSKTRVDLYDLTRAEEKGLIHGSIGLYDQFLVKDPKTGTLNYNQGYGAGADVAGDSANPKFTASFAASPNGRVTVTDPVNETSVSLQAKFGLGQPEKSGNRVIYPVSGLQAAKVYSLFASGVKEDIILYNKTKDVMKFSYELQIPEGLEARLESDGSIGIYGVDARLLGNVTTSSDKDAELLKKARQNSPKNNLLFGIPRPVVLDGFKDPSTATAAFELENNVLTVTASGLHAATYPLSIDPSIYVESAAKLMRGNNESNIDFDVTNELIQKSQTTGARIDNWTDAIDLPSNIWNNAAAAAGGYIYTLGGLTNTVTTTAYTSSGSFVVPGGVTSITVKAWGAGGGGGGGGESSSGGSGGAGGFAIATLTTTPAESLTVTIGTGGGGGTGRTDSGDGGGGGGHSEINRSGTNLIIAPGGGGGGGGDGDNDNDTSDTAADGGAGAAGGNTVGIDGTSSTEAGGGSAGTAAAGGAGGTGGANPGSNGGAESGGDGGDGRNAAGADGGANNGGSPDDGDGGLGSVSNNYAGGGGGGGGRFGGGGGSGSENGDAGGGGGGSGSCLTTGTGGYCAAGNGTRPGNDTDNDRSGAGAAGTGGADGAGTNAGGNGTAGSSGRIVISYVTASAATTKVYWAQFNNSTGAISSTTDPSGNGAAICSGWCNDTDYDLPAARAGMSLVAYNGYLYVLGGSTDATAANGQSTVWIAKLGANGEPSLWHPTGGTPTYWYASSNTLPTARSYMAATAYNNRLYLVGGRDTSGNSISTVHVASMGPTGDIGAWSTTGMVDLTTPTARFGHSIHVYNDVMYLIGGNNNGTLRETVYYSRLTSTGTMNTWVQTTSFTTARASYGGMFTTVWGGYIYLGGGCTTVSSGYCSAVASDNQIASINADGSLSEWNAILGLETNRIGYNFIGWQGGLYRLGGCFNQNTTTGACYATTSDVEYGVINPDGEASTVATTSASGTSPCSGGTPYNCDVPSASVGNMLNASVIVNGYLYIMGGCTNNACTTYSTGVTYQAIGSDGTLQRPASCTGSYTDSYCVSSTTLPSARGAPGVATFNNRIYLIGGFPTITNISYTLVNNDGSIGAWSNTDFTDIAVNGVDDDLSYTFAYARANPASASSIPGNLFIFGGCTNDTSGIGCSSYSDSVYKCDLDTSGVPSNCTETGQTQIGTVAGASGSGLGAHAGAVYANYIYLMGGLAPGATDLVTVYIAKFDDSNNVVESDGAGTTAWTRASNDILVGRRRGAGFGYNGYLYVTGGYDGTDALADIEFAKINVSTGDIGVFDSSSVSINKRWGLTVPVSNSYAYVIGGCIRGAAPSSCTLRTNTIQTFQIYNNDSGAIRAVSSFSDDTFTASTDRWGASSAILNGYLYVAGGCISATDCTNATNDVQYAPISAVDGSIGTWVGASNDLTLDRAWGKLVAVGGTLYYIGGQDDTATNEQSTVYYVSTFSSGDITAAWSTASGALGDVSTAGVQTAPRTKFGVAVWDNRIYVIGGLDGSAAATNTVYYSPKLASGGNIAADTWTQDTDTPDVARFGAAVTAYGNNLYQFGGNNGTQYLNDGQFASLGYKTGTIGQSGTTVTGSGTTFTSAMVGSTLQYSDGSTATITAYSSATSITVNANKSVASSSTYVILDGSVGAWTFTTSLPVLTSQAEAFAANGYMYVVGGRSAISSCAPNTLIAPISANTTIATGNNPTGVGEWFETNVRYAGGRYGAAVAYDKGKVYVMGGGCTTPQAGTYSTGTTGQSGTTVTGVGTNWTDDYIGGTIAITGGASATIVSVNSTTSLTVSVSQTLTTGRTYTITVPRHSYGIIKSQPQMAKYSRLIDTDTNVFPNSWLLNGLDNSIGARWQAIYSSAADSSNVVYYENFDNGTSGNTMNDSGSGLTSFDSCFANGTGTRTYDNTWFMTPNNSVQFDVTSTTGNAGCHDTYTDTTVRYERFYLRLNSSAPSTNTVIYNLDDTGGGNQVMDLQINTSGNLRIRNNFTLDSTITLDTTSVGNRIEVGISGGNATVRVFRGSNINGTTPDGEETFALSGDTQTDDSGIGIMTNGSNAWNWWLDDYEVSTSDWLGPSFPGWGQSTNVGDIFLGDVMPYTPKDSAGNNTSFARYYFFYITIDAAQTFGYPEDVSRGPTISDLSLFFTSDPGKRLRHGKTFTGGELQPLDTPCGQTVDADCPNP